VSEPVEVQCEYCGGWGGDDGWPCPLCGREYIH